MKLACAVLVATVLVLPLPAAGQDVPYLDTSGLHADDAPPCWPVVAGRVDVRMADGSVQRGVLLCVGEHDLVLSGSAIVKHPLASVREIVRPADPAWDGALKGAAVGLLALALCGFDCNDAFLLRATLSYAAFGAMLDAIDTHREVLYRDGKPGAALRVRVRF